MDFELSEEQQMLKDSVDRLTADRYPDLKTRSGYMQQPGGYSGARSGRNMRSWGCSPFRLRRATADWVRAPWKRRW